MTMQLKQHHFGASSSSSSSPQDNSINHDSSVHSSSMLEMNDASRSPTIANSFHHTSSPPFQCYMVNANSIKQSVAGASTKSMYRMSSFRRGNSLQRRNSLEQNDSRIAAPTYESIDIQNLSHLAYSNPVSDYCAVSGGSSSEGQSSSACISDPTITIPESHRLYQTDMEILQNRMCHGSNGYLSRINHYYPHPSDSSTYYPAYGRSICVKEEDFDIFNAVFALMSLTSYICCSGSSLVLSYFYYFNEDNKTMSYFTLGFVLVPSIIVNLLSLKWLLADHHHNHRHHQNAPYSMTRPDIGPFGWMLRILLHLFLMGAIVRYVELIRFGVKSWTDRQRVEQRKDWRTMTLPSLSTTLPRLRIQAGDGLPNFEPALKSKNANKKLVDYYILTVYEDRDSSLLSLFQSLMQGTLQLVLQCYSLLTHHHFEHLHQVTAYRHHFTEYVQVTVILVTLFEIGWSISSHHRALRRSSLSKRNLSASGVMVQFVWHCTNVCSRILAISLFVHQFSYWICPISIGHWGVMSIWVMHQGTHFFDDHHGKVRLCPEYLFNMLIGAIYLFVFINVKDEPTRYKYAAFYSITFAENILFSLLWMFSVDADLHFRLVFVGAVVVLFLLSMIFMQIYYWIFHPNGHPLLVNKAARCC